MKISKRSKITSSKETADRKTDRRIFPTNVRYKGYMIRLDRGGDGYNVYDKHGELEDAGYASIEKAKEFVDELENEAKGAYVRSSIDEDSNWRELASKSVLDSDGFYTDYTLYTNGSTFICMFGDKDIYEPDEAYADYETENEEEAYSWFDNYEGFADEDDLIFIDNRKSSIVNNDPSLDPGFDEYDVYSSSDIKASMGRYDDYFGQTAAATYGDLIADRLKGKSVSKRRDTANEPGGLIYEANKLGIDMWDLLEALEGMCNEGRAREINDSTYKILGASDLADEEDLPQADQEYDSAKTSINSNKLPAIYHMITLPEGSVGIDYGGGKFDNAVEALAEQGVTLYVYDPYNRSQQHNRAAIKALRANGGADFAINSNVLNVIKEPEARLNVLENIKKITKPGAPIYITVYEGSGKGNEGVTKSGYQLNRKTADYLEEIQEVFPDAKRKGKLIVATNKGSVNSSSSIKASSEIIWDDLDWNQQIQVMKRYIRNYKGTRIFEDFADYINKPVEDIIDSFCDAESYGDIKIPERKQLDSEYRNDDIYSTSRIPRSVEGSANKVSPKHIKSSRNATFQNDKRLSSTSTNVPETQMIDDLEYFYEVYPEAMEPILIRNGATPDKDNWLDGCNIPQAYNEAVAYFESKYDNDDEYSELDTGVGSRLGWSNYIQSGIYEELDSDDYGGAYYVEVNSTRRGTAPYEKKFSDFNSALSFAKKRGNSKTTIYIWDIPKEERSSNSVPNAVYDFDSGWQIIRPVNANEDRADDEIYSSTTSSSRYWYFTRHGVQPGSVPKYVNILDIVDKPEGSYFLADGVILTKDLRDYDIKERKPEDSVTSSTRIEYSDILEEIREQCSTKLIHIMAQYGFDEKEAKQYSRVDASIEDNQYGRIEIGCELDYDGLMRICQELDPIVQAYDPDSYFEPVDSGIAEAWINLEKSSIDSSSNIQAGAYDFPEPSLDPPEYPEPEEVDDYTQKIDLNLDAVIEIDQLGDWEYQDENYPWARCKDTKDGSWYSDEYDVFIADPVSIVERVDELLISKLPEKEGTYRIKGNVHLEYVVSNLLRYVHSYGPDDYDEDIDTDNAYVDFDFYNSNISDFKLTKI